MNYYIEGDAANADKIKAAFEAKGYATTGWCFNDEHRLYYTREEKINFETDDFFKYLIKTNPGYRELPVEPMFKVGEWVVFNDNHYSIYQIREVGDFYYLLTHTHGGSMALSSSQSELLRPWTIADAKDGDVLFSKAGNPFLFCGYRAHDGIHDITAYCGIDTMGTFLKSYGKCSDEKCWTHDLPKPATREQRDLLFAKMQEAGYQWDAGKRELRKIIEPNFKVGDKIEATIYGIERKVTIREVDKTNRCYFGTLEECIGFSEQDQWHLAPRLHYDISNFYAGMPVLVRDRDWENWTYLHYSHKVAGRFCAGGILCKQCIPFEGNERLVGTDEPCPEEFINW